MNFGALSRGFGTCCLRFKTGVATTPARLASGWLARLYREGVEPSGSLQKVSDRSLILLFWIYPGAREVSFEPPSCFTSFDHSVGAEEDHVRNFKTNRLCSFHIEHKLETRCLIHRQVGRCSSGQNFGDVNGRLPILVRYFCSVRSDGTVNRLFRPGMKSWYRTG